MNPVVILLFLVDIGIASISKELNPGYGFVHGYWPAIVGLVVASGLWIYNHALRHYEQISKGIWPSHWKANLLRLFMASLFILPINAYDWHWVKVIDLYLFGMCFFGIVFDLSLNHFRDLHPLHVGRTDKKDSITDRIFIKLGSAGFSFCP